MCIRDRTSDIEQEIKELDSIAKMIESTFDKPQNKEPSKPQSAQAVSYTHLEPEYGGTKYDRQSG